MKGKTKSELTADKSVVSSGKSNFLFVRSSVSRSHFFVTPFQFFGFVFSLLQWLQFLSLTPQVYRSDRSKNIMKHDKSCAADWLALCPHKSGGGIAADLSNRHSMQPAFEHAVHPKD